MRPDPSRRTYRDPAKACVEKMRWSRHEDAIAWVRRRKRVQGIRLCVYACRHCGGYHTARKRKRG